MKELELSVHGMSCEGCEKRIQNVLSELPNVKSVKANHKTEKVNIVFQTEVTDDIKNSVIEKIENLGYQVVK